MACWATILVPVFPANADERMLVAEGVRKGGWLFDLIGRFGLLEQRVIMAGFGQRLESACNAGGVEFLAVAGVPEDTPHAPRGSLLCLRQLLSAGQLAQDDPVVLFDYRYPLAADRAANLARATGDTPLPLQVGVVPPEDHPIQFEQGYRFEVTEVLRMLGTCPARGCDSSLPELEERQSEPFGIINRDLGSLPDGEAICFPAAGFHTRIVPAYNLDQFDASVVVDAARVRVESGMIRRLDNSRFINGSRGVIVGEPSLRPLRGSPFLAVANRHGGVARLFVKESYILPGLLVKVWPWEDGGFSRPMTLAVSGGAGLGMALDIAGHTYHEVKPGYALPGGVQCFLVAAMQAVSVKKAADWRERIVPDVPLWKVDEDVVMSMDGTPITCSQQFPPVFEVCGAVAAGPAACLLGLEPWKASPVILERHEALRVDSQIALLLLEKLLNRQEES